MASLEDSRSWDGLSVTDGDRRHSGRRIVASVGAL